jgi:tRNA pseudouridine55 synthase
MFGALVIDKPSGWTSHDVVAKMRGIARTKRIGHLGTLDPMATGVLPLLLGNATRLARFHTNERKVYEGVIRFGFSTNTYDAEGEATSEFVAFQTDEATLTDAIAQRFLGEIAQVPPPVSAKKINGVPAYKLARKNKEVKLDAVPVRIEEFRVLHCEGDSASVRVTCSPGTYVRSLAHDLGAALGLGAHLAALRRISSGSFTLEQAISIEEAQRLADEGQLESRIIPAASLLPELPTEIVDDATARQIRDGRAFRVSPFNAPADPKQAFLKAVTKTGALVAIGERKLQNLYQPALVFPVS